MATISSEAIGDTMEAISDTVGVTMYYVVTLLQSQKTQILPDFMFYIAHESSSACT